MRAYICPPGYVPFHGALVWERRIRDFEKVCGLDLDDHEKKCQHAGERMDNLYSCMECEQGKERFEIMRLGKLRGMEKAHAAHMRKIATLSGVRVDKTEKSHDISAQFKDLLLKSEAQHEGTDRPICGDKAHA